MDHRKSFVAAIVGTIPVGRAIRPNQIGDYCEDAAAAMEVKSEFNLKKVGKWYIALSEHDKKGVQQEIIGVLYIRNNGGKYDG